MQKIKELLGQYYEAVKKNQTKRNSKILKRIAYEKEGESFRDE